MKKIRICILSIAICALTGAGAYAQTITGQVRDAAYSHLALKLVSGVKVYENGKPENSTVTDGEGKYTLKDAGEEGFLIFEKDGYVKAMKKIEGEVCDMSLVQNDLTTISDNALFGEYINLDYPGLEKVKAAWNSGDVLMAKYELIEYYRNRETPKWNLNPVLGDAWKPSPGVITAQYIDEYNHIYSGYDISEEDKTINWKYQPTTDNEFRWGLNRMFTVRHMGAAYEATHDVKWAYEYQAQLIDWIRDNPKPLWKDIMGQWRTIEASISNHYCLPDSWYFTLYCEEVVTEAKITMIKSVIEHMEYLAAYTGTNNWLIFEGRGMYTLALLHPYFHKSPEWKEIGMGRADAQLQNQFKPDGWHQEGTPNYHMESANSLTSIESIAALNNEQTTMSERLRNAYDVENYFTFSGARALPLNDTNYGADYHGLIRGRAEVVSSYDTRKGADYLLTASDYRMGEAPADISKTFNWAGYSVMRDYWGPKNMMVYFEAGPACQGHGKQSRDKLQVLLSAYGRDMLLDGGVYSYESYPLPRYFYTSTAHNVALVDDQDQIRRANGMNDVAENHVSYHTKDFDYTSGIYDETFGELALIPVDQKRKVSFDKNGLIFVTDEFTGEGEHKITQNWNITQCDYKLSATKGTFTGTFDNGTGLMMIPLDGMDMRADIVEGYIGEEEFRGIVSVYGTPAACTGLQYNFDNTALPLNMNLLILPFKGEAPEVKTSKLETADGLSCIQIKYNGENIYYLTNHGTDSTDYKKFTFDGETAIIRCDSSDNIIDVKKYPETSAVTYNGKAVETGSLVINGIDSGDILKKSVTLTADGVSGGTVTYYAQINGETQTLATVDTGAEFVWNTENIWNATDVSVWAEWTNSAEKRKSRILRDIEISNSMYVTSKISLADRRFYHSENAVTLFDAKAQDSNGLVMGTGDYMSGNIHSDKQQDVKISARAYTGKSAVITVTVNGESKEITLTDAYAEYDIASVSGNYSLTIENNSENKVILNYLRNSGDGIWRENNKVVRSSLSHPNSTATVGTQDWANYEMTAKVMVSNVFAKDGNGIMAMTAYGGAVKACINTVSDKFELRINNAAAATADVSLDENVWYCMRLKMSGQTASAKVWKLGEEEPAEYMLTAKCEATNGQAGFSATSVDCSADEIVILAEDGTDLRRTDCEDTLCGNAAAGFSSTFWVVTDKRLIN